MEKKIWQFLAFGTAVALCAQPLAARQLSANEALTRAVKSEQSAPAGMRKSPAGSRMKLVHTSVAERQNVPSLYVFEAEKGGLLVATADDRLQPVLGVADSGSFNEIPANMQWWLSQYEEEIAAYYDAEGTDETAATVKSVYDLYDSWAPIEPICKTEWDQMAPFNALCPKVNGQETATGCVATALAQAIRAIGYLNPSGKNTYSNATLGWTVTFDYDNYKPDFSLLRDAYKGGATQAQRDEVAKLMLACGVAVGSNYNVTSANGTGANFVLDGIRKYLGFDNSTFSVDRKGMSTPAWETLCYEVLQTGKPLCYVGSGSGGHAFICDGYSEDGFFHFNWGWSGTANGYFRLSSLNPRHIGTGGFAGGYTLGQAITVLMTPDDEKLELSTYRPGTVVWDNRAGLNYQGAKATEYTFGYKYVLSSYDPLEVGVGMVLENRDGVSDDIYLPPTQYYLMRRYESPRSTFVVKIPKNSLPAGSEFDAYPVYSFKGYENNGYWKFSPYEGDSTDDHFLIKVSAKGTVSVSIASKTEAKLEVSGMTVNDLYVNDSENYFRCMLTNFSRNEDFAERVDLKLMRPGEKEDDMETVATLANSYMHLCAGESMVLDANLPMKNIAVGNYELWLYRNGTNAPLTSKAMIPVEIKSGKRPEPAKTAGPAGNYEVALWVDGANQALAPVVTTSDATFSGVTSVITNMSVAAQYSLAFFKHGETVNPIKKFAIADTAIKGDGTWKEGSAFSVKPELGIGAYTMAFIDQYETLVSYPVDYLVGTVKDGIVYNYDADSKALTVSGAEGEYPAKIVIPAEVESLPVAGVADGAFDHCSKVEEIRLPSTIEHVGLNAFRGASSLRYVYFDSKTVPFANNAMAFASVNSNVEYYVTPEGFEAYKPAFKYRGRLYASISEVKLPAEVEAMVGVPTEVAIEVTPAANYNPNFTVEVSAPETLEAEVSGGKVMITPKAEGEAKITVTSAQPGVAPVEMTVKVAPAPEFPVEITVTPATLSLTAGESAKLTHSVKNAPEGAEIIWSSSDPDVATVSASGEVKAVSAGEAEITVSCLNAKAVCKVKVAAKPEEWGLKLNEDAIELIEGKTFLLWFEFTGKAPDDVEVTWTTSDETVATINARGLVTAVKAGEAIIAAVSGDVKAECRVSVKQDPDMVSINEIDADADVRYYDLTGRRVASPRGIVIKSQGGKATIIKK